MAKSTKRRPRNTQEAPDTPLTRRALLSRMGYGAAEALRPAFARLARHG